MLPWSRALQRWATTKTCNAVQNKRLKVKSKVTDNCHNNTQGTKNRYLSGNCQMTANAKYVRIIDMSKWIQ